MKILVTGASGWIGSATLPRLVARGHEVVATARSDSAATTLSTAGVTVVRADLEDPESMTRAAEGCDAVIHLAYHHDFTQIDRAAEMDRSVLEGFGEVLAGSGSPLLVASGVLGVAQEGLARESDPQTGPFARSHTATWVTTLSDRGIQPVLMRFPPTVHGRGDIGFIRRFVEAARIRGMATYVDEGQTRWSAVHRDDAADLIVKVVERPTESRVHAVGEEGVSMRDIAEAIGVSLGIPTVSISRDQAQAEMGFLGMLMTVDASASSELTQRVYDWRPEGPTLLEDVRNGAYLDRA